MTDMEGLDRAVEEARLELWAKVDEHRDVERDRAEDDDTHMSGCACCCWDCEPAMDALIAAVSAKARAEERERAEEIERILSGLVQDWAHWGSVSTEGITEAMAVLDEHARSSEEAGNGG